MKTIVRPVVFVVAGVLAAPFYAQAAVLEEIVVTARKRDESFQDLPASVRAFTASEIESAGINTPQDFIGLTPNVTLVQTQNAGNSFINIRGVSQARNSEMSAAVLVDGVLMANPAQFNQELFDIQQIEVLRGPQGALYGRNAIGGAITIVTQQPTDEYEGRIVVGADDGPGYRLGGVISGPLGSGDTLKFRASGSYFDTDGYIDNPVLGEEADPYKDISGRLQLGWQPTEAFSADLRLNFSQLETQALYFTIAAEADDTSLPVRVNNAGVNERDLMTLSLKLDYETSVGTFTSITAYDDLEELLTGDQFNFVPREESFGNFFPDLQFIKDLTGDAVQDLSQTQFLDTDAWSQEFRFTSPSDNRLRWIAGAYFIATDRYISTGNQIDRGNGVFPVKRNARVSVFVDPTDPSPQLGLLVDEQDNFAWAVFGDITYDFTDQLEGSFSLRYDRDERENTTLTEPIYDPTFIPLTFGEVRKEEWDDLQPKVTLRYKANDDLMFYGGYSRGFRSGGFNQSGVGEAVPEPGVNDLFDEQTADTVEVGTKGTFLEGRLNTSLSIYYTKFDNAYFFFFDPSTSTQNLGNIDEVTYIGFEFEGNAQLTNSVSAYYGIGYVDSEIDKAADPADVGNQAPLVSEYTVNLGGLFRYPMNIFGGLDFVARIDYERIGDTWWDPSNISKRSPIDLVNARIGVEVEDNWSLMLWGKNIFDEEYNTEFSPGPAPGANFLFPAPPDRFGIDFIKRF